MVYVVPVFKPAIIIGLVVPDASENETPEFVEYWYFVNTG